MMKPRRLSQGWSGLVLCEVLSWIITTADQEEGAFMYVDSRILYLKLLPS